MYNDIIVIGSITYALKAKKALSDAGIRARIQKLDTIRQRGCSYGLEIPVNQMLTVAAILRPLNIDYEIYQP